MIFTSPRSISMLTGIVKIGHHPMDTHGESVVSKLDWPCDIRNQSRAPARGRCHAITAMAMRRAMARDAFIRFAVTLLAIPYAAAVLFLLSGSSPTPRLGTPTDSMC
jgi:hypothetical protein